MRIIILSLGLLGGTLAYGESASEHLEALESLKDTAGVELGSEATNCANFTGTWRGSCQVKISHGEELFEESKDVSLELSQIGCASISMDGSQHKSINVSVNKSYSSELGFRHQNAGFFWMDEGQRLAYMKDIEGMNYQKDSPFRSLSEKKFLRLVDDNTLEISKSIKTKSATENDQKDVVQYNFMCSLNRL